MIYTKLWIVEWSGSKCANPECKHDPKYHDHVLNTYFLKKGETCLEIGVSGENEFYCRPCIDDVYKMIKSKLDTNLWVFQ